MDTLTEKTLNKMGNIDISPGTSKHKNKNIYTISEVINNLIGRPNYVNIVNLLNKVQIYICGTHYKHSNKTLTFTLKRNEEKSAIRLVWKQQSWRLKKEGQILLKSKNPEEILNYLKTLDLILNKKLENYHEKFHRL